MLRTPPAAYCSATAATPSMTVGILVSGATAANYEIRFERGTLTIEKADLIATAIDQQKVAGQSNPALEIRYTGFVNGDTEAALDVAPMISTDAGQYSADGSYVISLTSGSDGRYNIITEDGTMTITADASGTVLAVDRQVGISPNGDGINDTWVIEDIEKFPNSVLRIYSRSGQVVFEMKGYDNSFEGFSNKVNSSVKLPVGPYLYTIDFNTPGVPPAKGWVYINY